MNIEFSEPIMININDINMFSKKIGYAISDSLQKFFINFGGSEPEPNISAIDSNNDLSVTKFIPVTSIIDEGKYIDHVSGSVFPIAIAEGGNYVVIDFSKDESIYFWDHEIPDSLAFLKRNISLFLESLNKFNDDEIKLKEGQVNSVWVDPSFLDTLEKYK